MRDLLARVAGRCVERPLPVLVATVLIALVATVAALGLEIEAGTDQLVDDDSAAFVGTEEFRDKFGDDAVVVLVEGDLEQLVLTSDLGTMLALEGCLSGNAAGGQVFADQPAPEACAALAESKPARVVYGPATFLNQFVEQAGRILEQQRQAVEEQARQAATAAATEARDQGLSRAGQRAAAGAAAEQVQAAFTDQLLALGTEYGLSGLPRLDDPRFVSTVVFDSRTPGQPKSRFSYLFPSEDSALISVRLRPDLTDGERADAIELIREAVADPAFAIRDTEYVVSGVPVVVEGLSAALSGEIAILLGAVVLVMAITLALVLGRPLRLLPLLLALVSAALVFGLLAAFGGSLTMASLAVLPILIGLAVDYAIQFQARFNEAAAAGGSAARAAVQAAASGGPVIGTAALATAAGFCVLLLSPIPMVRDFGLLLVAGIAVAFGLALTGGLALLSLTSPGSGAGSTAPRRPRRAAPEALDRVRAARRSIADRIRGIGRRALGAAVAAPGRVLVIALVIAVAGWALGTRAEIQSDIRELVPASLPELENVDALEEETGVSGEIDVTVKADDLTDPEVITWMGDFKRRVLERAGFSGEAVLCQDQDAQLCPSIALPDLFTNAADEGELTTEKVRSLLELLPTYFSQAVIEVDPETGEAGQTAVIAFGIKVMPFDEQKQLIDAIRAEIDPPGGPGPPEGVTAEVVGLPVLAADANAALDSNRYLLTVAGLVLVALVLIAVYRSARRALVPLVPIVLATGWSSLVLELVGVPLNPMSATLGALVIAIATEFSVLLAARYAEERDGAGTVGEALRRAYSRTGMAVLASGVTAIAGFAALIATDIQMLRDFGLVTVLDLSVALLGVLIVLPAALVWAEQGFAPFGGLAQRGRRARPVTDSP